MASSVDNSPCTVYEALAYGIPFLAARSGGVPELIDQADHDRVLFDCTTAALCKSLLRALEIGGGSARRHNRNRRRGWVVLVHQNARRYLTSRWTDPDP